MGCNCSSKPKPQGSSKPKAYTLTDGEGRTQSFASKLQATAANIRELNGSGIVKQA